MVPTAVLARPRGALYGEIKRRPDQTSRVARPVQAFRRVAASVAADTGRRGAEELLACAARQAERAPAPDGPAPAGSIDRTRRQASIASLADLIARHQIAGPSPRRHVVHDTARVISVPSTPIHATRGRRGWIVDRQSQPDPDRTPHGHVHK